MNANQRGHLSGLCLAALICASGSLCARPQNRPDPQTVEAFFNAIAMHNTNAAAQLLESNTNLASAVDNFTKLPLNEAAAAGNVQLVRRLLELGVDVNGQGDTLGSGGSQNTALHCAIQRNFPEVCKVLLEAGTDPNRMTFGFETPLHLAFKEGHEDIAGLLLDYGADPFQGKLFSNDDTTPFEMAITRSSGKLVARMLGQDSQIPLGAKSLQKPRRSKQPRRGVKTSGEVLAQHGVELLTAAAQRGELEAVLALVRAGVSVKNANTNCPTILQTFSLSATKAARDLAGVTDQLHQAQARLKADYIPKADPHFVASLRLQESSLAAKVEMMAPERWQRILEVLKQHGADYDAFAATALGDTNQTQHLLSADKGVSRARDCSGATPLHWSIQTDRLPLASFWIAAGVPLDATNSAGQTALHLAASAGKVGFARTLLAARAATNIRDTNGWTPLDAAIHAKQSDCIHLLLPDESSPPHPERGLAIKLHEAAATGNLAVLAALLESESNLEARNELGLTPLQVAVQNGHLAAAALLVDKGANVNARDPEGNTLLLQTIPRFFNFFVKDRPPTNWLDRMGNDPRKETYKKYLTVGQYEQGPHGIMQTVCFLLVCGIDVKATNQVGQTAIQLAADEKIALFDDREPLLKLLGGGGGSFDAADANGNTPLHRLAHGFFSIEAQDSISGLLASGANVNATNSQGRTPLHETIQPDYIWQDWMKMLLEAHADANAQDTNGFTPLHLLALSKANYGQGEAARALIKAGAKADLLDKQGRTPLFLAINSGAFEWDLNALVQALLDAGANPNVKDAHGRTGAHLLLLKEWPWRSASGGMAALAKAGADLSAKDDQGKTPLHYLAGLGSQKPLFFIRGIDGVFVAAKVDFQARDKDGNTPLQIAAKTGTTDVFDWLVKQGANLDATNNQGETARLLAAHSKGAFPRMGPNSAETDVSQAAREGNIDAATRLLNADPKLANQTNQFQQTPLRVAVMQHQTNMVRFLETHGARWDEGSAVMAGRTDVLKAILKQTPSAAATKVQGKGLLHMAAANGDVDTVTILIAAHCDLQAGDNWGLSPLGYALIKNHKEVQQLLLQHGAKENFFDAVYANDSKTVATLLAQDNSGASSLDRGQPSAMDIAAAAGYTDILKLLLKSGAAMANAAQTNSRTPVHVAAFYNQTNALALLIGAGAKVNQVDQGGFAPLHWATIRGATEAATLLLKQKADADLAIAQVEQRTSASMGPDQGILMGDTPLHLAALCGETNILQLLLKSGADVNAVNRSQQTPLDLADSFRPTSPFSIVMIQRGMLRLLEPLGFNQTPANQFQLGREGKKEAAALIKSAGGKHSQNRQPFGGR